MVSCSWWHWIWVPLSLFLLSWAQPTATNSAPIWAPTKPIWAPIGQQPTKLQPTSRASSKPSKFSFQSRSLWIFKKSFTKYISSWFYASFGTFYVKIDQLCHEHWRSEHLMISSFSSYFVDPLKVHITLHNTSIWTHKVPKETLIHKLQSLQELLWKSKDFRTKKSPKTRLV